MAASLDYLLLSRIVETRDFHTVQKMKITEEYFFDPHCRGVFRWIEGIFTNPQTYGQVPSWDILHRYFPWVAYVHSTDSVATICDMLRRERMRHQLHEIAETLSQQAEADPREGIQTLRQAASVLTSQHEASSDVLLADAVDSIKREYDMKKQYGSLTGLPWPWAPLNESTQGIRKGDFIIIYGRPKSMKSWVGLFLMTYAYIHARARALIVSFEMTTEDMQRRVACIIGGVDYKRLQSATLTDDEYSRFCVSLDNIKVMENQCRVGEYQPSFLMAGKDDIGHYGAAMLQAKMREFQPTIVMVDSFYLMQDDRQNKRTIDWKAQYHISQDLRQTALAMKVPIIGTTQANRQAGKTSKDVSQEEMAFGDAFLQDCTMAIRVIKKKNKNTGLTSLHLVFPGSRETELDAFVIHGQPATNFTYDRQVGTSPEDNEPDEEEQPKVRKRASAPAAQPAPPVLNIKNWER